MESWSDSQGPPLKKMRKGTKSCSECRRRKIRCTYNSDCPDACNECRLRGSKCITQEHGSEDPHIVPSAQAERYSLRERVTYLENVVKDLVKRLDDTAGTKSSPERTAASDLTPSSIECDKLGPSSERIEHAPVMQLFDNYVVSRREDSSSDDQFAGAKDMSVKARAVRIELLALFPHEQDIRKILSAGSKIWCIWEEEYPELRHIFSIGANACESTVAPAEIAKALVCLCLSLLQSPPDFNFGDLRAPLDIQEFTSRCMEAVDRLVVRDDDYAATLPGIECSELVAKYHLNEGRLRKCWLVTRRTIEFAYLAGMHLSTRTPQPGDTLFQRRLKTWCLLGFTDRTISLILGLPYGIAENFYLPQIARRLQTTPSAAEQYMLRIGVVTGHMCDRNQNPSEMSLETTLKLDRELQDAWEAMPAEFQGMETGSNEKIAEFNERVPLQFMPKMLRALLHMPFMLKYPYDSRFSYSQRAAIQSTREALVIYKVIRSITRSYLCKIFDFMSFTLGLLMILHLIGYSEESPDYDPAQDECDWNLIGEVIQILRQAASQSGGSVAAESANILSQIYESRNKARNISCMNSCKISVPYFGTITASAGAKFIQRQKMNVNTGESSPSTSATLSSKPTPTQIYTPPLSNPDLGSTAHVHSMKGDTHIANGAAAFSTVDLTQPFGQGASVEVNPFAGLESNVFTGLFDDIGQYSWPNANIDLGLDQGWNLNWLENPNDAAIINESWNKN
ncbi:hypothetical protein N7495_002616 [Penicillium taxi]|uniref:uncharacterized protein n=1 Tax=Penicillium taxi TaxID=168475 RepID=UPI0025452917|nr:uncharacterized protein N7495_002616 [Penicillium taxi]KAJ5902088.1 hypothetical protein N7495_002616 [Penicillium taxi]